MLKTVKELIWDKINCEYNCSPFDVVQLQDILPFIKQLELAHENEIDKKDNIISKLKEECNNINERYQINIKNMQESHNEIYDNLKLLYKKLIEEIQYLKK